MKCNLENRWNHILKHFLIFVTYYVYSLCSIQGVLSLLDPGCDEATTALHAHRIMPINEVNLKNRWNHIVAYSVCSWCSIHGVLSLLGPDCDEATTALHARRIMKCNLENRWNHI